MGCAKTTFNAPEMFWHWYNDHSVEECERWGINKEIFELSKTHEILPDEFFQRKLTEYSPPKLLCEKR